MTLVECAESVQTREDFVAFLEALRGELAADPGAWNNRDLPSYLEAMSAWTQDMDGYYASTGKELSNLSPWRVLADIMMAARIYE